MHLHRPPLERAPLPYAKKNLSVGTTTSPAASLQLASSSRKVQAISMSNSACRESTTNPMSQPMSSLVGTIDAARRYTQPSSRRGHVCGPLAHSGPRLA